MRRLMTCGVGSYRGFLVVNHLPGPGKFVNSASPWAEGGISIFILNRPSRKNVGMFGLSMPGCHFTAKSNDELPSRKIRHLS